MASRSALVKELRELIAAHDLAAIPRMMSLRNAAGVIKGAPELIEWALEKDNLPFAEQLAHHVTAKQAAQQLFNIWTGAKHSPAMEEALWAAAGDVEPCRLAVRADDWAFFEQARRRVPANHRERAFHQTLNEVIQCQRAEWVSRLLTDHRRPTSFHARYLGDQDVPATSPLLSAFEASLSQLSDRKAREEFLYPAAQTAIIKGHRGPLLWALEYARARDASWRARYPQSPPSEGQQLVQTLACSLLPWVARENQLALLDDVLPWADVNKDAGAPLRLAVQNGHRAMAHRLMELSDLDTVIDHWSRQKELHHLETLADWATLEQRQAWLEAYGDHLPRLRARMREETAGAIVLARPSRPRMRG